MKYLIVILAFAALAHAEYKLKTPAEIKAIQDECLKEHPASAENVEQIKNFLYPDNDDGRKNLLCSVKKMGLYTDDGGINIDDSIAQFKGDLDEAEVRPIVVECAARNPEDSAETFVIRAHKCFIAKEAGQKVHDHIRNELTKLEK